MSDHRPDRDQAIVQGRRTTEREPPIADHRGPSRWLLACLALVGASACTPDAEPTLDALREAAVLVDLSTELAFAEGMVEPRDLAIGEPAARRYLGNGWSRDEATPDGEPFVWATGPDAEMVIPIVEPRDLDLIVGARPFRFLGAQAQTLAITVNGRSLGQKVQLAEGRADYAWSIPTSAWIEGENQVTLHWAWARSPAEMVGTSDRRALAAAVHRVALLPTGSDPNVEANRAERRLPTQPRADDKVLWLPWGSRVDFFLEPQAGAFLIADSSRGRGAGHLTAEWSASPGPTVAVTTVSVTIEADGFGFALAVPNARGPLRLRLTGIGSGSEPGGVSLRRPRIVTVEPVADRDETAAEVTAPSGSAGRRPIVLWVVDTLRADRLGPHGGPVPTPHLDAFAAESLVFERAIAQSSWTKASMGSVFTGRSPLEHGAYRRDHVLSDRAVTLAELLSAAGYRTAAFGTNPNLTEAFGFAQGFDHFVDLGEAANAGEVVDAAVDWLRTSDDERPLFLWLHPIDPHSPYVPPDAFREEHSPHLSAETARRAVPLINDMRAGRRPVDLALVAEVVELYDTEIAWSDRAFGRLREALADASLDDAIVLVLSDHGEEFYEHGNFEHGRALFAESIHVPFMLHWPEGPVGRVREAVQHLDVLPTLLDAVGVEAPRGLSGQSLLDGPPTADRPIFSHLHLDGAERVAVERGRFKLLAEVAPGDRLIGRQLYDLVDDPKETRNLAAEQPIVTGRLATLLRKHLTAAREGATVETVEIDEETRRRLEALGYL